MVPECCGSSSQEGVNLCAYLCAYLFLFLDDWIEEKAWLTALGRVLWKQMLRQIWGYKMVIRGCHL